MAGISGPKAHEVFGALGAQPGSAGKVVQTSVQSGRSTREHKDADKQNRGFSGTPMWKIIQQNKELTERAARLPAPAAQLQPPEGFVHHAGDLFWSEKRQVFWQQGTGKLLVRDPQSPTAALSLGAGLAELCEGAARDVGLAVGAACQDGPRQTRHVLVRDLIKASQALRMPIDHLDRPCALYALYEGGGERAGCAGGCAEFCAKHMHEQLLRQLSSFRGRWDDGRLADALHRTFRALEGLFLERHPTLAGDKCAAAVALVTGGRLAVASAGDAAGVLCLRGGEAIYLMTPRDTPAGEGRGLWGGAGADDAPKVRVEHLRWEHQGLVLACRSVLDAHAGATGTARALRQWEGRPRLAARDLAEAARGAPGAAAVAAFLDVPVEPLAPAPEPSGGAADAAPPPAKRQRAAPPDQVRLRHIILKHRDCKNPVDKVRGRPVKRSRAEAERALCGVLRDCERDAQQLPAVFSQRCRELSECVSSLKGGDLAGDMSWVRRGKFGAAFDEAAFALQVGQLSDLVDSDQGVHLLWRTA